MNEQDILKNKPAEQLPPVSPEDIDNLIASGNVENLTTEFDQLLDNVINRPDFHPNKLMFLDKKTKDIIASLDEKARKATAVAKNKVAKILKAPEEEVPTVTMTKDEARAMAGAKAKELTAEEKRKIIKDLKKQISEVADELKKVNEEERSLNREKSLLIQKLDKTKKVKDRIKIESDLSKLRNNLLTLSRRRTNIQKMRDTYNRELANL